EGDPLAVLPDLVLSARLEHEGLRLVAGDTHYSDYNRLGLRGAVAKLPADLRRGAPEAMGRDEIRALLQRQLRGFPALRVSTNARWTLNALAAGYARAVDRRGQVSEEAQPGVYRTL